ncbi:hypothetical protein Tco_1426132, partial [Tanacetum coccineum]
GDKTPPPGDVSSDSVSSNSESEDEEVDAAPYSFFKCLPFELPVDVVNKTLQIILELQFFKLSLFDLYCHHSSKSF